MRRLQNSQLRTGTSIGRRGYANYIQEMFTLKGDEFEALTAADCEARGEHE